MVNQTAPLHHIHLRKRLNNKLEPYPHPNKSIRFIDKAVYFVGIIGAIMTLPQVLKIWIGHNAGGISLISWLTYFFAGFVWLTYGIIHKAKPIIFTQLVWIFLHLSIVVGTILYS